MERLTFEGNFCDIAQCRDSACKQDGTCTMRQVWERLKQFENVFKTPEKATWAKQTIEMAFSDDPSKVERLRELFKADKDGRCIVLPCKRGDELWAYGDFQRGWGVYKITVSDLSTLNGRTVLNTNGFGTIRPEDIGKTVFLSREEAEKALQEMEGKKDG